MRIAAASLLLALAGQERPPTIDQIVRALAAAQGDEAVDLALKSLDTQTPSSLEMVRREAARQGPDADSAARRELPSRAWAATDYASSVGPLRKSEREWLGRGAKDSPEAYSRAVAALLASEDPVKRRRALRLFEHVRPPDPKALIPFLKDASVENVNPASMALARWGGREADRKSVV